MAFSKIVDQDALRGSQIDRNLLARRARLDVGDSKHMGVRVPLTADGLIDAATGPRAGGNGYEGTVCRRLRPGNDANAAIVPERSVADGNAAVVPDVVKAKLNSENSALKLPSERVEAVIELPPLVICV